MRVLPVLSDRLPEAPPPNNITLEMKIAASGIQPFGQWWRCLHLISQCLNSGVCSTFEPASCWCTPGAAGDGSSAWTPVAHVGGPYWVPGSCSLPAPAPAGMSIWGNDPPNREFSVSPCLPAPLLHSLLFLLPSLPAFKINKSKKMNIYCTYLSIWILRIDTNIQTPGKGKPLNGHELPCWYLKQGNLLH